MSDLSELVEPLKRAVAVPGAFADTFPSTSDDDLAAVLLDAFAEAQLYGFFSEVVVDDDGITTPDIERASTALVVLFAANRILEVEVGNRKSHVRFEAGGAVFEQDQGTQLLTQRLKDLAERKRDLLARADRASYDGTTLSADLYFIKSVLSYGGADYGYQDALGW